MRTGALLVAGVMLMSAAGLCAEGGPAGAALPARWLPVDIEKP